MKLNKELAFKAIKKFNKNLAIRSIIEKLG